MGLTATDGDFDHDRAGSGSYGVWRGVPVAVKLLKEALEVADGVKKTASMEVEEEEETKSEEVRWEDRALT